MKPMLSCGHQANAYKVINGARVPACVIDDDTLIVGLPDLEGRKAQCGLNCGKVVASTLDGSLAFFEYRGEGSHQATFMCKHCPYMQVAHEGERRPGNHACDNFEPHGAYEFDSFYDGCHGWD